MVAVMLADKENPWFHAHDFFHVYSDYVLEQLQELPGLELEPVPLYRSELEQKVETAQQAEIILSNWGMPELTEEEIRHFFPKLKAVLYAGSSVRTFCAPFFACGVRIFCAGEANAIPASEYALAQILLANKGCLRTMRNYLTPETYEEARKLVSEKTGNYQAKVGILGVGRVGSRVAQLLRPFDVTVIAFDPYLSPQKAQMLGVSIVSLEEVFASCEVITCHLPDTPLVANYLGYQHFSLMMPGSTFINCAQGGCVDEDALIRALNEDPSRTAVLDSTVVQPLPENHPLFHMHNVFLTPHIAGSFGGEVERMGETVVAACKDFLNNVTSKHEATLETRFWIE